MNAHTQLHVAAIEWTQLRSQLAAAFGLDENDDALPDTLDGMSSLGDQCHALLQQAGENEMFAEALDKRIAEYRSRKDRLTAAAKAIRSAVAEAAGEAGLPTLKRPDMTVSFGFSKPSLEGEADAATLPDDLVRVKREANRTAIKAAIEGGRDVPGFRLSNGRPSLTVRRS